MVFSIEDKYIEDPRYALRVSGFATIFWKVDDEKELFTPQAFSRSLKSDPAPRAMTICHITENPVGVWDFVDNNDVGLWVSGVLSPYAPGYRERIHRLFVGDLEALSVGFDRHSDVETKCGTTIIDDAELLEIALVDSGMMPGAEISEYKWISNPYFVEEA